LWQSWREENHLLIAVSSIRYQKRVGKRRQGLLSGLASHNSRSSRAFCRLAGSKVNKPLIFKFFVEE
jgi:hypothetical protein